jgi:hypothetical protein
MEFIDFADFIGASYDAPVRYASKAPSLQALIETRLRPFVQAHPVPVYLWWPETILRQVSDIDVWPVEWPR